MEATCTELKNRNNKNNKKKKLKNKGKRKKKKETSFGRKKDIISAKALCSGKC